MGRNSGKRVHRRKNFAPPPVPDSQLKVGQNFGVITGYHGGAGRYMTIVVMDDGAPVELKHIPLKGSLVHVKCHQRVSIGALVIYEYGQVVLIMADDQRRIVPPQVQERLYKELPQTKDKTSETLETDDLQFYPSSDSDDPNEDDDDVLFEEVKQAVVSDIDLI